MIVIVYILSDHNLIKWNSNLLAGNGIWYHSVIDWSFGQVLVDLTGLHNILRINNAWLWILYPWLLCLLLQFLLLVVGWYFVIYFHQTLAILLFNGTMSLFIVSATVYLFVIRQHVLYSNEFSHLVLAMFSQELIEFGRHLKLFWTEHGVNETGGVHV